IEDILRRLFIEREKEFTPKLLEDIEKTKYSVHEILTLASIVEREVRGKEDREKVADLFLRRLEKGWALQADSTVHYISGRNGDVFTKKTERDVDSLWNTYKYPGLPPGPISTPSIESIMAVVYPKANPYWYFLTDFEGNVHYGKTLEEHNTNRFTYL
ncbi:MAG: endolytic transglycosylase MltG, partial [Candidatus Magasanikbacteria bacterium]|nr:endolytic transglycosylase MltG [Candidatus Magasanikbacteria bacterium]